MAPTPARRAKAMYAVTLVIQWRFSCSSCLRPICLSSACRFLSRLSVLMMRLRVSITSLRSCTMSAVSCEAAGGSEAGLRGLLVSSGILIMLPERTGRARASHAPRFQASFSGRAWERPVSMSGRMALFLGLEKVEHQPQGEQVSAHIQVLLAVAGVHLRARQGVAVLDHQGGGASELPAHAERQVGGRRVGLVVGARAGAGVERVA